MFWRFSILFIVVMLATMSLAQPQQPRPWKWPGGDPCAASPLGLTKSTSPDVIRTWVFRNELYHGAFFPALACSLTYQVPESLRHVNVIDLFKLPPQYDATVKRIWKENVDDGAIDTVIVRHGAVLQQMASGGLKSQSGIGTGGPWITNWQTYECLLAIRNRAIIYVDSTLIGEDSTKISWKRNYKAFTLYRFLICNNSGWHDSTFSINYNITKPPKPVVKPDSEETTPATPKPDTIRTHTDSVKVKVDSTKILSLLNSIDTITVDYSTSNRDSLLAKYSTVSNYLKGFKLTRSGKFRFQIRLFNFPAIQIREANEAIKKSGCFQADAMQLLVYGLKHLPVLHQDQRLVASGQTLYDEDRNPLIPVLTSDESFTKWQAFCLGAEGEWHSSNYFLGVREIAGETSTKGTDTARTKTDSASTSLQPVKFIGPGSEDVASASVITLDVNYNETPEFLLSRCRCSVMAGAEYKYFPNVGFFHKNPKGVIKNQVIILEFKNNLTRPEIETVLDKLKLKPADYYTLITLGIAEPNLQKKYNIVSTNRLHWLTDGGLPFATYPCLTANGLGQITVDIINADEKAPISGRILAVRK